MTETSIETTPKIPTWRISLVGIGLPTLLSVIALVLTVQWYPRLPDPVAVHWGGAGVPDGFGPPATYLAMTLLAWLLGAAMAVPLVIRAHRGTYGTGARWLLAMAVWLTVLLCGASVGGQWLQLDLTDAATAPSVLPTLLWSALAATLLGGVAYAVLPKPVAVVPSHEGVVVPMTLAPSEKAAWSSIAVTTRWIVVPVACAVVVTLLVAVFTASAASPVPWMFAGLALLLAALLALFGAFRVSVGDQGLVVRSYLGWPSRRIPLDDIKQVAVVELNPLDGWGGYGWRTQPRGTAVITRNGVALQVTRRNGRVFAVTAEDCGAGASLLAALVARSERDILGGNGADSH